MRRRVLASKKGISKEILLLLHLDGNFKDEAQANVTTSIPNTFSFIPSYFNKGLLCNEASSNTATALYDKKIDLNSENNVTIDFWVNRHGWVMSGNSGIRIGVKDSKGYYCQFGILINYNGYVHFLFSDGLTEWDNILNTNIVCPNSGYHHLAVTCDKTKNEYKLYIDGQLKRTAAYKINSAIVGSYTTVSLDSSTEIDEVCIRKGIQYTSNFTPPNKPY